jgi:hypothetical protein
MRLLLRNVSNISDFLSHLQVLINQQKCLITFVNIIHIQSVIIALRQYVTALDFIDMNFELVRYFTYIKIQEL